MATRVSQHGIEVARSNDGVAARVTQEAVEVMRQADAPRARVTQMAVEVMRSNLAPPSALLTQVALEVARAEPPSLGLLTQVALEVARAHVPGAKLGLRSWMVFDKISTLDVLMVSGESPTSAADDVAVCNGENAALVGNEIIQFRDVQDLGGGVFRLSRLLRGRLGTESFMNSHTTGELVVLLDPDTVRRVVEDLTDLNAQRYFKVIGAGLTSFGAPVTPHINSGVSQKPWQPIQIAGTRDGSDNLTITWRRRSRIGHQRILVIQPPVGEIDERYEVDILTGAGTVVRTIETTSQSATYTAAEQTTDFGSVQNPIAIAVYQLSNIPAVDRGYPGRAIV